MKNETTNNKQYKQKGLLMKTKLMVFGAAFCAFVLLGTTSALAAGTPVGTIIKNVASMTYNDLSGNAFTPIKSDTAYTTVEQIAGVTLTPSGSLKYSSDSMYVFFPHTVTNTGNGSDTYTLSVVDNPALSWGATIVRDLNGNGVVDTGDSTTTTASTGSIAADAMYKIFVRAFVPNLAASGLLDTLRATATSTFVDNGTNPHPTASASVRDSISTKVPQVTLSKTNNNASPTPGAAIVYTLQYTNSGTVQLNDATLVDTLETNLTFVSASATSGSVSNVGNIVTWTLANAGDIAPGATATLTINTTAGAGLAAGTELSNHAYLFYTDSISGRSKYPKAGPSTSTVISSGSWNIQVSAMANSYSTDHDDDSVNVSQTVMYKLRITNNGNRLDSARFTTRTSSIPLTWTLYRDLGTVGTYEAGTDTVFAISTDTVIVSMGGTANFIARTTVAQSVADSSRDSAYYRVASTYLAASDSGWHITNVQAPRMTLTKSVSAINGRSRPGDTLLYTIRYRNNGSGAANQIIISDILPATTTYIPGSLQIQNSAITDTTSNTFRTDTDGDSDGGSHVSGTIQFNVGNVASPLWGNLTYTGIVRFRVKIN